MNLRDVLRRFRLPRIASSENRTGETEDAINLARILGNDSRLGLKVFALHREALTETAGSTGEIR